MVGEMNSDVKRLRISELSSISGIAVSSIKYYIRVGILPPGRHTASRQATYGDEHLRRLGLIRAMREMREMRIAEIAEILRAVDAAPDDPHQALGLITGSFALGSAPESEHRTAQAREIADRAGWTVHHGARGLSDLQDALDALARLLPGENHVARLLPYAEHVSSIAELDLDALEEDEYLDSIAEKALIYTVVYDRVLAVMRRLAQESVSAARTGIRRDVD